MIAIRRHRTPTIASASAGPEAAGPFAGEADVGGDVRQSEQHQGDPLVCQELDVPEPEAEAAEDHDAAGDRPACCGGSCSSGCILFDADDADQEEERDQEQRQSEAQERRLRPRKIRSSRATPIIARAAMPYMRRRTASVSR